MVGRWHNESNVKVYGRSDDHYVDISYEFDNKGNMSLIGDCYLLSEQARVVAVSAVRVTKDQIHILEDVEASYENGDYSCEVSLNKETFSYKFVNVNQFVFGEEESNFFRLRED